MTNDICIIKNLIIQSIAGVCWYVRQKSKYFSYKKSMAVIFQQGIEWNNCFGEK